MNNTNSIVVDLTKGNTAKILAILALGLGSFLAGILPAGISLRNRLRFPLLISLMLCFGGGVLLATAIVHMLPDVRKMMPEFAEVVFCCGFFIIYFIDEFVHYFFGEAIQHSSSANVSAEFSTVHQPHRRHSAQSYGTHGETEALLSGSHSHTHGINNRSHCEHPDPSAHICHTNHTEPCTENMTGTLGLLCALSLHSFIEGLAIGIQNSQAKVMILLGAVACHKYVMGFCLGLELCSNSTSTLKSHFMAIAVFSLGSAIGIGAGMAIVDLPDALTKSILPILQALAGGTLLYVTVSEVLPREKARWHRNAMKRYAGFSQFLAVFIGFTIMTVINFYLDDD